MAATKSTASSGKRIRPTSDALPQAITKIAKSAKAMKPIFRGKVMSFSGDFGENWTHEQMANWIKLHGGEYVREITEGTTHLICTIEDYKRKTVQVKNALALGGKCYIIIKDWLEDCLAVDPSKKRCLAEKDYTLKQILRRAKETIKAKDRHRKSFDEGVQASHELVDNRRNHIYMDDTGFEYKVVCTRINTEGKVKSEKYIIYLFESNAKPCHYMAGAKLSQGGRPPTYWRAECRPKAFREAFDDFRRFFESKTGIHWDDRLDGTSVIPDPFKYDVTRHGRPVGLLPVGKKRPWEMMEDEEMPDNDSGVVLVHDSDSDIDNPYARDHSLELTVSGA